jgi:hypothetical protein
MNIHIPTKKPANWTDEEKETAVSRFLDGMSTPDIAALMNRTKGSVCGLLDRVRNREIKATGSTRIPARYQMGAVQTFNREKQKRAKSMNRGNRGTTGDTGFRKSTKRQAMIIPTVTEGMEYDAAGHGLLLTELKATDCRFIVSGEGADALFCGQHATGTYCEHHFARCHYSPKEGLPDYFKRITGYNSRTGAFR